MTSHPAKQCCTVGVIHEGTPTGKLETIEGTETYVARPSKPKQGKAILLFTDVIGHGFSNAQLIADQYAANGYLTIVPDLFNGDAIPLNRPEGFDLQKWLGGAKAGGQGAGHGLDTVEPIAKAALKYLQETEGVKRIATVGYCFGAKYVVRSLAHGYGAHVGYVAHPSFVDADEIKAIKGPLSIAAAETDQIFPADKRKETEELLPATKQPYQITLYSGVQHGFAVRGDMSQDVAKYAKEAAFLQAVQWIDYWL